MSALLPIFPGQRERWARPRPEPVLLELPGWSESITEPDETFPNQRWITFARGPARIELTRYWDSPRNPGHPMATASEREIDIDGRKTTLVTTSTFDGAPRRVHVFWLTGEGHDVKYGVRVVIARDEDVDVAIAATRVVW